MAAIFVFQNGRLHLEKPTFLHRSYSLEPFLKASEPSLASKKWNMFKFEAADYSKQDILW